jgi:uncharacterized protein (DUF1697 family)
VIEQLAHLDPVNIGAAGTFVIRQPISQTRLRAELKRSLPFETEIMICDGRDIAELTSRNPFADEPDGREIVRFVSILSRAPRSAPPVPMTFPSSGSWLLKVLARDNRFLVGLYRRHMKAIAFLGKLDRIFGVPVTTRNWNTINSIANVLGGPESRKPGAKFTR